MKAITNLLLISAALVFGSPNAFAESLGKYEVLSMKRVEVDSDKPRNTPASWHCEIRVKYTSPDGTNTKIINERIFDDLCRSGKEEIRKYLRFRTNEIKRQVFDKPTHDPADLTAVIAEGETDVQNRILAIGGRPVQIRSAGGTASIRLVARWLDKLDRLYTGSATYASNDAAVATVDAAGTVTGVANGETTIRTTTPFGSFDVFVGVGSSSE